MRRRLTPWEDAARRAEDAARRVVLALVLSAALLALCLPSRADFAPGARVPLGTASGQTLAWSGFSWQPVTFLDVTGSAVGIGTTNPQAALHVVSPAVGTPTLELQLASGQTADALDVFDSTGATKLASLSASGASTVASLSTSGTITCGTISNTFCNTNVLATKTRAVTASYSVQGSLDSLIICTGTFTVTLPAASGYTGRVYTVKDAGTGTITVTTAGGTLDGATTITESTSKQSRTFQDDGTNYQIIGGYL